MKTNIVRYRTTLFEIHFNQELSEETQEALKSVPGVESPSFYSRYHVQITVGTLFDISQVEKDVRALVQSQAE